MARRRTDRRSAGDDRTVAAVNGAVVIPYDDAVATAWAELAAAAIHGGRDRSDRMDWWIAACAIRHGLPLVTHDSRDFDGIEGLTVITHPDPA